MHFALDATELILCGLEVGPAIDRPKKETESEQRCLAIFFQWCRGSVMCVILCHPLMTGKMNHYLSCEEEKQSGSGFSMYSPLKESRCL